MLEDKLFIGNKFKQNCGDILIPTEKISSGVYSGFFIKYKNNIIFRKNNALKGQVNNPQIEIEEFKNKKFKQNCGCNLEILDKSNLKSKDGSFLWKCKFENYTKIIYANKQNIKKGSVYNYELDKDNLINKIFPQTKDSLIVLEKSNKYENTTPLYKCKFIKYPYVVFETRNHILRGKIGNPIIEEKEFIGKIFKQNCGDSLKVIEKSLLDKYKCKFLKYSCIVFASKSNIINGNVDNNNFPYKNKENLLKFIKSNFKDKPTLRELSLKLNKSRTRIGHLIIEYNLQDQINYFISNEENNLFNKYKSYNFVKYEDNKYEIDLYNKDLKFGIEYNGNIWHSNDLKFGREDNYHQNKSLYFKKKNIQILHFFEYELDKREIIYSLIDSKLGIFNKKIGARKCEIKEISYREYSDFCNKNHLQGECIAKIRIGLFYKNELIQIMSFSKPRFTDKYEYEIIRECSKLGYCIIGGKNKLWKYFVKKYKPNSVISYCDFSKFTGESYLRLGFKFERLNKPGFVWYNNKNNQVYWRNPYHNKEMKDKGYLKIYDAGQLVFVWNKI